MREQVEQGNVNVKGNSAFRVLFRAIIAMFIIAFVGVAAIASLGFYYQDEVKNIVIAELNKGLNTEVIVDGKDIELSLIESFPFAAVNFFNVKALEVSKKENPDTLFSAGIISLQFNILDIIDKHYSVKKIALEDAAISIKEFKDGSDNYHFFKTSTTDTSAVSSFDFSLEDIYLENIQIEYKNYRSKQQMITTINKADLAGNFSNETYDLSANGDYFIAQFIDDQTVYVNDKRVLADVILHINRKEQSYNISQCLLQIQQMQLDIEGCVVYQNDVPNLDLKVNGKNMNIQAVLSLIPNKYKTQINAYKSKGEFKFDAAISGVWSARRTPLITANFKTFSAEVLHSKNNIAMRNINLTGSYTNGNSTSMASSVLNIQSLEAAMDQGNIKSDFKLSNFNKPYVRANVDASIDLAEMKKFFALDTIESFNGAAKIKANVEGLWKDVFSITSTSSNVTGDLMLENMSIKIKNQNWAYSNMQGDFSFNKNDLVINRFSGNVASSDFEFSGMFKNVIGFIFKDNQDLTIDAMLISNNINLDELLENKDEKTASNQPYKLAFSDKINFNLTTKVKNINFRKFNATNLTGNLLMLNQRMMLDPIQFNTMNGSVVCNGSINGSKSNKIVVNSYSELSNIDVTQLFEVFENFDQTTITNDQIKGAITADVHFKSNFNTALDIDKRSAFANIDMKITNGELIEVEALNSLSRFVALEELKHIKFEELTNKFEIKNEQLVLPNMEIKSTALNLTLAGTHGFDNTIDYRMGIEMEGWLFKKAKNAKRENEQFGRVKDDGLGKTRLFITMKGTVDEPIIKYDKREAIKNVKKDIATEKQTVKRMLKEEFGIFKKDTITSSAPKKEPEFIINWEEADEQPLKKKKHLQKPKRPEDEEDF